MPSSRIVLDATDGSFGPDLEGKTVHKTQEFTVGAIPRGMNSGLPSICLVYNLPDGSVLYAETSLAIFVTAARAFVGRYGDPTEKTGDPDPSLN